MSGPGTPGPGPRARWSVPLRAWAASRALVLAVGLASSLAFGAPTRGVDPAVPDALAQLGGWDTTWYLDVARHGYAHDMGQVGEVFTNLAFFPLLPAIMAALLQVGPTPSSGPWWSPTSPSSAPSRACTP